MPGLYRTDEEKRALETRNGALQFYAVLDYVERWKSGSLDLTPDILKELQRLAVNQIYTCAGNFRDGPVWIMHAQHEPPDHTAVPRLVDEMCEYVNENWPQKTAAHLASYLMWRVNWIHPFFGGYGRTSRAVSYLVLCAKLGFALPGTNTIPDQIVARRRPYFDALKAADVAWTNGTLDLSAMEELVSELLAAQLVSIHEEATGKKAITPPET